MNPNAYDPYYLPEENAQIPGGLLAQLSYQHALSRARSAGMLPGHSMFAGEASAYQAAQNQQFNQQQAQLAQMQAMGQAEQLAQAMAGAMRMAGREVTPDVSQGFNQFSQTVMPTVAPLLTRFAAGRNVLDAFSSGGVSSMNVGAALGSIGYRERDPFTDRLGTPTELNSYVASSLTDYLRMQPATFDGRLAPVNSRGFSGQQAGEIISEMKMRGLMPNRGASLDLATDPRIQSALASGAITRDQLLGVDRLSAAERAQLVNQEISLADVAEKLNSSAIAGLELMDTWGINSDESLAEAAALLETPSIPDTTRDQRRDNEIEVRRVVDADRRGRAQERASEYRDELVGDSSGFSGLWQDAAEWADWGVGFVDGGLISESALATRYTGRDAIQLHGEYREALREDGTIDYRKLSSNEFDRTLLEYAAETGSVMGVQNPEAAADLTMALQATRQLTNNSSSLVGMTKDMWNSAANSTAQGMLDQTQFARLSRDEKIDYIALVTGQSVDEVKNSFGSRTSQDYGIQLGVMQGNEHVSAELKSKALHNPFNIDAELAGAESRAAAVEEAAGPQDFQKVVYDDIARRTQERIQESMDPLSAVRDILGDDGIQASTRQLFEVMNEITNNTSHQFSGQYTEMALRDLKSTADRIGYTSDQLREVAGIGNQIAKAAGLSAASGMGITQEIMDAKALYSQDLGVNRSGVFGAMNADQMATQRGMLAANFEHSEEGRFMAAVGAGNQNGEFEVDTSTEEGRLFAAYIKDSADGLLTGDSLRFAEDYTLGERLEIASRTTGESIDYFQQIMSTDRQVDEYFARTNGLDAGMGLAMRNQLRNEIPQILQQGAYTSVRGLGITSEEGSAEIAQMLAGITGQNYDEMPSALLGVEGDAGEQLRNTYRAGVTYAEVQRRAEEGDESAATLLSRFEDDEEALEFFRQSDSMQERSLLQYRNMSAYEVSQQMGEASRNKEISRKAEDNAMADFRRYISGEEGVEAPIDKLIEMANGGEGGTLVEMVGSLLGEDLSGSSRRELQRYSANLEKINKEQQALQGAETYGKSEEEIDALAARAGEQSAARESLNAQIKSFLIDNEAVQGEIKQIQDSADARQPGAGERIDKAVAAAEADSSFDMYVDTITLNGEVIATNARASGSAKSRGGVAHIPG